jgi:hypothetical protein
MALRMYGGNGEQVCRPEQILEVKPVSASFCIWCDDSGDRSSCVWELQWGTRPWKRYQIAGKRRFKAKRVVLGLQQRVYMCIPTSGVKLSQMGKEIWCHHRTIGLKHVRTLKFQTYFLSQANQAAVTLFPFAIRSDRLPKLLCVAARAQTEHIPRCAREDVRLPPGNRIRTMVGLFEDDFGCEMA